MHRGYQECVGKDQKGIGRVGEVQAVIKEVECGCLRAGRRIVWARGSGRVVVEGEGLGRRVAGQGAREGLYSQVYRVGMWIWKTGLREETVSSVGIPNQINFVLAVFHFQLNIQFENCANLFLLREAAAAQSEITGEQRTDCLPPPLSH